ncbi:hypothetical protein [Vampirovibrio sp.]|uniref:hypothetical protein n=1 Tax=Vampirovibrio sp. TaxID=2717857 RepID=UPI0035937C0F
MSQVILFPIQQAPSIAQQPPVFKAFPDYSIQYGSKYERGLDVAEIAKRVRAELKAQVKAKQLPKARVRFCHQHPAENPLNLPRFTEAGQALIKGVEAIVAAYNYDGSDTASDYWNVNFYSSVFFAGSFEQAQRALILEWME